MAASPARPQPPADAASMQADSAYLAGALAGGPLELSMRGTTVPVIAGATSAEDGCAALVTAQAPGKSRKWARLFRWSEAAWSGTAPDGRTMVAFYEDEARLPADTLAFAPIDPAAFHAALTRVVAGCRTAAGASGRIALAGAGAARGCYFAALPALQLIDPPAPMAPAADPPRALLTVLSRETPQAELQLLLQRAAPDPAADGDDWGQPAVAFSYANARLKEMRIAEASFALDARPVAAEHALTAYGETRVRISMDPFKMPVGGRGPASFYRRLAASGEATLTLLDAAQQSRAVLHFDAGAALAAARMALKAADWSCAGAAAAPEPAAKWRPAD